MNNKIKLYLNEEFQRLSLWYIGFYFIGILFYFSLNSEPSKNILISVIVSLLIITSFIIRFRNNITIKFSLSIIGCFLLGFTISYTRTNTINPIAFKENIENVYVSGKVTKIKPMPYGAQITLDNVKIEGINKNDTPHSVRLNFTKIHYKHILTGDIISVLCDLSPTPLNIVPNSYNFSQIAYFNKLGAIGKAKSDPEIINYINYDYLSYFIKLKKYIYEILIKKLGFKNGNIAAAMFLGETGGIDQSTLNNMRMAGVAHILCVSGLHLSTVAFIFFLFSRLVLNFFDTIAFNYDIKKLSAYISLIFSFFYLVITGMQIAATRAFIMTSVVIWSIIIAKQPYPLRTLGFAASIILTLNPEYAIHPSFQLSFIAVLSLLVGYEFYIKSDDILGNSKGLIRKIKLYLVSNIYSSLVASLATAPIVMYHFYVYSNYSLLANLVIVPLFTIIIMPIGIIALAFSYFDYSNYIFLILNFSLDIIKTTSKFIVSLPYSVIYTGFVSEISIIIYILSIFWISFWIRKNRYFGFLGILLFLASFFLQTKPDILINKNSKYFSYFKNGDVEIFSTKLSPFAKRFIYNWYGLESGQYTKINSFLTNHSLQNGNNKIDFDLTKNKLIYKNKEYIIYDQTAIYIRNDDLEIYDFSSKRFIPNFASESF